MGGGGRGGRSRARTQRKHFKENRENVWKRSRHDSADSNNSSGWEPFATQNPAFDEYYKVSYVDCLGALVILFVLGSMLIESVRFIFSFALMHCVSLLVVEAVFLSIFLFDFIESGSSHYYVCANLCRDK